MSARLIQVIETSIARGKGTEEDPVRTVRQYWSADGKLLAEDDPEHKPVMRKSQADKLMKNLDFEHRRTDTLIRWLKERQTLKPTQFKEAITMMLERSAQSSDWWP